MSKLIPSTTLEIASAIFGRRYHEDGQAQNRIVGGFGFNSLHEMADALEKFNNSYWGSVISDGFVPPSNATENRDASDHRYLQ